VRLLQPLWPERIDAMASELETLGDSLGDDHDLAVLRQDLDQGRFGDGHARDVKALGDAMAQRQRQLRSAALALGARFYAEKPGMFCDRLAGYWKTWRHEKKPASDRRR
jgi:CHAD domain-containing protein